MELKERLNILKKRWLLVALITASITMLTGILSFFVIDKSYKADISIIIGGIQGKSENSGADYYNLMMYQTLVKTYSKLAASRTVAEDVISKLKLNSIKPAELIAMIKVSPDTDTQFITISVTAKSPEKAVEIVNQYGKSLSEVSYNIYKEDNVKVLEAAVFPDSPASPRPLLNIGAAAFISFLFSTALAFLLEYMDCTIKNRDDLDDIGIPMLGTVSKAGGRKEMIIC